MKKQNLLLLLVLVLTISGCGNSKQNKQEQDVSNEEIIKKTSAELFSIDYRSPKPMNGKLKGVVELGASGFNSFIIELDKDKNWEIKRKEFGNSYIIDDLATPNDVKRNLKSRIKKILDFGVKKSDVYFVVSSGATKEKITTKIIASLKNIGYVVNVVTIEEEALYALKSVLPKSFKNHAFVIDIGSGNTKISFYKGNEIVKQETYGSKYYKDKIFDNEIFADVKSKLIEMPLSNQKNCFIIGGVPYQLAKKLRKEDERYTLLHTNVEKYKNLADEGGAKIKCGLNIYDAVLKTTNCKNVIFDWDANFTIGFLLETPY